MPIRFTEAVARFDEMCSVEEALPLLEFLKSSEAPTVDLANCTYLHTALLQLLLVARPKVMAAPGDPILARWALPLLSDPLAIV